MSMLFNNECHHPEENYLFSMEIEGENYEFCLRYGNDGPDYRSSWNCEWIERSISHHSKFAYDFPGSAIARDQFIDLKRRLQDAGFWDLEWNLDSEVRDLRVDVEQYNDSPRFKRV